MIFFWMTRPWWHGILMYVYRNPVLLELFGVLLMILVIGQILPKTKEWFPLSLGLVTVAFPICMVISGMYTQSYLAKELPVREITELPEVDPNFVRVIPLMVAKRYASDAMQYPQHTIDEGDIAIVDGKPSWAFALIPDGIVNVFRIKDKGGLFVDMTTSEKNTRLIEKDLQVGPGMAITDSIYWQIFKKRYWIDLEDYSLIPYKGDLYIIIPFIRYEYKFRFPIVYMVPRWGGIVLINSEGKIEFLNPEQAREHPVLSEQKLFPDKLARYYVESLRFSRGIGNFLFHHEGQLEISDVPEGTNPQPFLVKTKNGSKWVVACEPYGRAYGIFKVLLIDTRTGEMELKNYSKKETLLGPVRAVDYVRKANPIIDWSRMMPVEPLPIVINGTLFWEVRIVPSDGSGIAYIAFVNSLNGEVKEAKTDEQVRKFLGGIEEKEKLTEKPEKEERVEKVLELLEKAIQEVRKLKE